MLFSCTARMHMHWHIQIVTYYASTYTRVQCPFTHHTAYRIDTAKRSKEHNGHEIILQFANKEKQISINFVRFGEFLQMRKDCVDPNGIALKFLKFIHNFVSLFFYISILLCFDLFSVYVLCHLLCVSVLHVFG